MNEELNQELTKLVNIHSDKTNYLLWLLECDVTKIPESDYEEYRNKLNIALTEKKEAANNIINFLRENNEK